MLLNNGERAEKELKELSFLEEPSLWVFLCQVTVLAQNAILNMVLQYLEDLESDCCFQSIYYCGSKTL